MLLKEEYTSMVWWAKKEGDGSMWEVRSDHGVKQTKHFSTSID